MGREVTGTSLLMVMFAPESEAAAEKATANLPVVLLDTTAGKRAVLPLPNWIATVTFSPGVDDQPQIFAISGAAGSTMFEDKTEGSSTEGLGAAVPPPPAAAA